MNDSNLAKLDLKNILRHSLPIRKAEALFSIIRYASQKGFPLYVVGGFVRDLLLESPVSDLDIVFEGNAILIGQDLSKIYGGQIRKHPRFLTASWIITNSKILQQNTDISAMPGKDEHSIDLITARSEYYKSPGELPIVSPGTIHEDIRRRDFTINSLAIPLNEEFSGNVHDVAGGFEDLQNGKIRVLHSHSFFDDPTRMFRAVRYAERYGFKIEAETLKLFSDSLPLLSKVSGQRVRNEIDLVLHEEHPAFILEKLFKMGLFNYLPVEFGWNASIQARIKRLSTIPSDGQKDMGWIVWLSNYSIEDISKICEYFHLSSRLRIDILVAWRVIHSLDKLIRMKPSQCAAFLEGMSLLALQAVLIVEPMHDASNMIRNYLSKWKSIKLCTTGNTLIKLGITPGPKYELILREIRAARIDGVITTDKEEMLFVDQLLSRR